MCKRAAIIRNGEINAVEEIQSLLKKQMKKARFIFKNKPDSDFIEGFKNANWMNNKLTFEYVGHVLLY